MTIVAFIGLGIMGGPMAGHLVDAGHEVIGVNRSRPPVDRLVAAGNHAARVGAGPIDTVVASGILLTFDPLRRAQRAD